MESSFEIFLAIIITVVMLVANAIKAANKQQAKQQPKVVQGQRQVRQFSQIRLNIPEYEGVSAVKTKPRRTTKPASEPVVPTPTTTPRRVLSPRQRALRNHIIMGEILMPKFKQPHEITNN